jgi:NADPH2:quinone reductase
MSDSSNSLKSFRCYRIHKEEQPSGDKVISGRLETNSIDQLDAGQLIVRVAYSSINYKDALAATGEGKIIREFPLIGGIDLAGTVHESKDDRFKPGDEVIVTGNGIGERFDGGYAEFCRVECDWTVSLPGGMDLYTSMALGTAGFTAAQAIHRLEHNGLTPEAGEVLVTGATGGVGSFAINMLSELGYSVTALTGKLDETESLKRLGASKVLSRHDLEMGDRPLERAQYAAAIDNAGGQILSWLTRVIKPRGGIGSIGMAGGAELNSTVMPFILRGINLFGIASSSAPMGERQKIWQRLASDLRPKNLDDIATQTVKLDQLQGTFDAMMAGTHVGRTVVAVTS